LNQVGLPNKLETAEPQHPGKKTCSSRITSILFFCADVKVKGVDVSIGSSWGDYMTSQKDDLE
jgi:hypothetical protein